MQIFRIFVSHDVHDNTLLLDIRDTLIVYRKEELIENKHLLYSWFVNKGHKNISTVLPSTRQQFSRSKDVIVSVISPFSSLPRDLLVIWLFIRAKEPLCVLFGLLQQGFFACRGRCVDTVAFQITFQILNRPGLKASFPETRLLTSSPFSCA